MKGSKRHRVAVEEGILNLLNQQVKLEAQSSASYLAMASWCDQNGYETSAEFFYAQSDEERAHMLKLFHFISDMGGEAISPEVKMPTSKYGSLKEVFELTLDSEIRVTKSINEVVAACRKANDFATENFMQWYVKEQVEEEFVVRRILELFDMLGDDPKALLMIDERVNSISYSEEQN
ncbi:MAG: ferritin [Reichenbachiella sp.]